MIDPTNPNDEILTKLMNGEKVDIDPNDILALARAYNKINKKAKDLQYQNDLLQNNRQKLKKQIKSNDKIVDDAKVILETFYSENSFKERELFKDDIRTLKSDNKLFSEKILRDKETMIEMQMRIITLEQFKYYSTKIFDTKDLKKVQTLYIRDIQDNKPTTSTRERKKRTFWNAPIHT